MQAILELLYYWHWNADIAEVVDMQASKYLKVHALAPRGMGSAEVSNALVVHTILLA